MGIVEYAARELLSQLDKTTQEFYEFIMPAIDIYEDGHELVIEIELPGFRKDDINIRIIDRNMLSIKAQENEQHKNKNRYHVYTSDKDPYE
jgi:HSP20 family protein